MLGVAFLQLKAIASNENAGKTASKRRYPQKTESERFLSQLKLSVNGQLSHTSLFQWKCMICIITASVNEVSPAQTTLH